MLTRKKTMPSDKPGHGSKRPTDAQPQNEILRSRGLGGRGFLYCSFYAGEGAGSSYFSKMANRTGAQCGVRDANGLHAGDSCSI